MRRHQFSVDLDLLAFWFDDILPGSPLGSTYAHVLVSWYVLLLALVVILFATKL